MGSLFPGSKRWYQYATAIAVVVACVALVHGSKIPRAYHLQHYETRAFIQYNDEHVESFSQCFTTPPYYPGLYRPVATTCYYYLGIKMFGNRVEPFKVVNVVFVVINAFLFFLVVRQFLAFGWSLVPVALFASRKAHIDVVVVSVEMQTLLSVFYSLLMLYLYIRARREGRELFLVFSYLCFVLALLSKETSVTMVALLFLYEWLFERDRDFRQCLTHLAIALVWAAFVIGVIRRVDDRRIITFNYSILPTDVLRNYLSYFLDFFNFLLPPIDNVDQSFGRRIEVASRSGIIQAALASVILAGAALIVRIRKVGARFSDVARLGTFGFALFVVSMAPYAIVGERLLMRYSYVGHLGVALSLGAVVAAASSGIVARVRQSRASPRFPLRSLFQRD